MAQMTSEQREHRALLRARRAAEAAEEDDRRLEERRQQWQRDSAYMSRAELEAGELCRGCSAEPAHPRTAGRIRPGRRAVPGTPS